MLNVLGLEVRMENLVVEHKCFCKGRGWMIENSIWSVSIKTIMLCKSPIKSLCACTCSARASAVVDVPVYTTEWVEVLCDRCWTSRLWLTHQISLNKHLVTSFAGFLHSPAVFWFTHNFKPVNGLLCEDAWVKVNRVCEEQTFCRNTHGKLRLCCVTFCVVVCLLAYSNGVSLSSLLWCCHVHVHCCWFILTGF